MWYENVTISEASVLDSIKSLPSEPMRVQNWINLRERKYIEIKSWEETNLSSMIPNGINLENLCLSAYNVGTRYFWYELFNPKKELSGEDECIDGYLKDYSISFEIKVDITNENFVKENFENDKIKYKSFALNHLINNGFDYMRLGFYVKDVTDVNIKYDKSNGDKQNLNIFCENDEYILEFSGAINGTIKNKCKPLFSYGLPEHPVIKPVKKNN